MGLNVGRIGDKLLLWYATNISDINRTSDRDPIRVNPSPNDRTINTAAREDKLAVINSACNLNKTIDC